MARKFIFEKILGLGLPLVVQLWDLYSVCNEKTKTLAEVWVDGELRVSFQRTFSELMM
jgi:hypothetical protein